MQNFLGPHLEQGAATSALQKARDATQSMRSGWAAIGQNQIFLVAQKRQFIVGA
jgi:hypothetical protein